MPDSAQKTENYPQAAQSVFLVCLRAVQTNITDSTAKFHGNLNVTEKGLMINVSLPVALRYNRKKHLLLTTA